MKWRRRMGPSQACHVSSRSCKAKSSFSPADFANLLRKTRKDALSQSDIFVGHNVSGDDDVEGAWARRVRGRWHKAPVNGIGRKTVGTMAAVA